MEIKLLSGALGAEITGIDLKDSTKENYEKIKIMNEFIKVNKNNFDAKDLKFSAKLKK